MKIQVVLITIFERERHFLLYIAPHKIMNLALLICPAGLINKDQPHKLGGVILKSCSGFEGAGAGLKNRYKNNRMIYKWLIKIC